MRLKFILGEVANGLRRNSTMALSVVLVTFVSLTFVGAAALIQAQIGELKQSWYGKVEVTIGLCPENARSTQCAAGEVTEDQKAQILAVLNDGPVADLVKKVYFESKEEAFENYKRLDNQGISDLLTADQMQASFRVKLKDPEQFQVVSDAVAGMPGVDYVQDQRDTFAQLFKFLNAATLVAAALAAIMLLAAGLLITTTIRLSALSRRRETTIMRMVGSSRTLIQAPFLLEGAVAATLGAVLAVGALYASVRYVVGDWLRASLTWIPYIGEADVLAVAPYLIAIAVALAAAASVVTLGKYTRA
ncbi:MAG: permease-like cell division protein FtsX [Demequina sp.]|jgi:cell division transport system permease protein|nr:permease-like cell division protein FtsX [Demequina sp.]